MFWKTLKMELARAIRPGKVFLVSLAVVLLFLVSDWEMLRDFWEYKDLSGYGSINQIYGLFVLDTFKCVLVILMTGLYTSSFCKDDNNQYLRMLLSRTDVTTYTQCRFIANLCVILLVSIVSLYVYVGVTSALGMPLFTRNGTNGFFYRELAEKYPLVYVGMNGLVFGMVAAACSSIGLLYSSYKTNSFVCIGISGLVFYMALSYIPYGTLFDVLTIVAMGSVLGFEAPRSLMFLWSITYMLLVIGICGVLFWRRMKWRVEHGYL